MEDEGREKSGQKGGGKMAQIFAEKFNDLWVENHISALNSLNQKKQNGLFLVFEMLKN